MKCKRFHIFAVAFMLLQASFISAPTAFAVNHSNYYQSTIDQKKRRKPSNPV